MQELWRPLPGFPRHIVSDTGRIARLLKPKIQNGYHFFELTDAAGDRKALNAARAVALAWHGPPPHPRMDAAHHNGNKLENTPTNVRWKTRKQNHADKIRHGRQPYEEAHHLAKITRTIADNIRAEFAAGGINKKQLARKHGISPTTVRRIIARAVHGGWSH